MGSGNIKKFELKLGRTGVIITIAGMAALLCAFFVLGVTVGKNINTHPEKISSLPQELLAFFWRPAKVAVNQSHAGVKEAISDNTNMDLTFHNDLTQSKTTSIQPPPSQEKKQGEPKAIADSKVQAPSENFPVEEKKPVKEAMSVLPKSSGEKTKTEDKVQKKDLSAASDTSFLIHVASLKEKNKADQIHKSVSELGYKAKVVKVDIKGKGTWYRVIIPGFETKSQAKVAGDKISRKVKANCVIRHANADTDKNP